jgi:hypothetical protein
MNGVPLTDLREQVKCGVAVVDLHSGVVIALLEFQPLWKRTLTRPAFP